LINATSCRTCGSPTDEDDLGGLCAPCVLKFAVEEGGASVTNSQSPAPSTAPLLNIPGYAIREEIARGGMGIVYRAVQREPEREVALKMLLPHQMSSPGMLERFRLEARAIAALEHPAILPVYHVGEHNGLPFFTMKLAIRGSLAQCRDRYYGEWQAIGELIASLAGAVQFAHDRGVLHRDLKPGNVLFDEAGRAYVSDFGLAKLVDAGSELTRSVDLLGTPHYVAPEVAARSAKEATTASDIYSLGSILYELLAGRPPFEAEGVPALLKKIAE
jgi:eukaryotic-like serine/threonine-protein kinase